MREIKFRAWDTINNVMVVPEKIINPVQTEAPGEINCFVLMQYVGKQDKNGKEIFEGDYNQNGEIVIWCNECSAWQFGLYDFPTKDLILCHNCDGNFLFQDGLSDIEIIGNIYEHPELKGMSCPEIG